MSKHEEYLEDLKESATQREKVFMVIKIRGVFTRFRGTCNAGRRLLGT